MAGTQDPSAGTDFWAALGIGPEATDGGPGTATVPPEPAAQDPEPSASEWIALFSGATAANAASGKSRPEHPPGVASTPVPGALPVPSATPPPAVTPAPKAAASKATEAQGGAPAGPMAPDAPEWPQVRRAAGTKPSATQPSATQPSPETPRTETMPSSRAEGPRQAKAMVTAAQSQASETAGRAPIRAAESAWPAASPAYDFGARADAEPSDPSAASRGIRPRDPAALAAPTSDEPITTGGFHDAIGGWQLIDALWRDQSVIEIHIRGAEVSVCRPLGIERVPGFAGDGAARAAIDAITAAQHEAGAVVRRIGGSVVVSRRRRESPGTAGLVAAHVITDEQVSEVEQALGDMRAVTVAGPAAPVIVRALASLVPPGSRVFQGHFGVLPIGCVAAASPLDADYVVGVRPGTTAEEMAAAGQIGALVANPRTPFAAALRLAVSGRSAAPGKVTAAG